MTFTSDQTQFAEALKSVARNLEIKEHIQHSPELYPLFQRASKRFVTGESIEDGVAVGNQLITKGYRISLEFIGENTVSREAWVKAKKELLKLMHTCGIQGLSTRTSCELAHIGVEVESELAVEKLFEMAKEAHARGLSRMISAEASGKTEQVLSVYKR